MPKGLPRMSDGPFIFEVIAQRNALGRGVPCTIRIEINGAVPAIPDQTGCEKPQSPQELMEEMASNAVEFLIGDIWVIRSSRLVTKLKRQTGRSKYTPKIKLDRVEI